MAPATHILTDKATKIHTLTKMTYELIVLEKISPQYRIYGMIFSEAKKKMYVVPQQQFRTE